MPPPSLASILLVLRDPDKAREIQDHFRLHDFSIEWVTNDEQAINGLVSKKFDVVLTELQTSRIDGLRVMGVALDRDSTTPVVLLSDGHQTELALQALDDGATAFHQPPYTPDVLRRSIEKGLLHQSLQYEIYQLKRQLDTRHGLPGLVGRSRAIAALHDQVRQCASGSFPIIIVGEPGTGKDHLAKTIHNQSPRSHRAFLRVSFQGGDVAAMDRLLFGHAADVYPDSPESQAGQIENADEGTLYLDGLNQLTRLQSDQLIAAIETRQVQRFGEARHIAVDVRIIISIEPPLDASDPTNEFLKRLQHQFGALTFELAPLRTRAEDIPVLADHFIALHGESQGKAIQGLDAGALQLLSQYAWPDNVRELENVIHQMVSGARDGATLAARDIPARILHHPDIESDPIRIAPGASMAEVERVMIEATMKACDHDKGACAKILGIGLRTLYRKLNEYAEADASR